MVSVVCRQYVSKVSDRQVQDNKTMASHFWTAERIDALRQAVANFQMTTKLSNEAFVALVDRHVETSQHGRLISRTVGRFVKGDTEKPSSENLVLILVGLAGSIVNSDPKPAEKEFELSVLRLYHAYLISRGSSDTDDVDDAIKRRGGELSSRHSSTEIPDTSRNRELIRHRPINERKWELDLFLNYLDLDQDASASVAKRFFRGEERRCFFDTYRFSATKGRITKSFTMLARLDPVLPMVRFANFLDDDGHLRVARGICLRFHDEVAFIGNLDSGSSLKVMTFENARTPVDLFRGILVTSDSREGSLASRFIMKRTDSTDHTMANTGGREIECFREELNAEEINLLRNRIDFSLEDELQDKQGGKVSQEQMVHLAGQIGLKKKKTGNPFNPALDKDYTFNSALLRKPR